MVYDAIEQYNSVKLLHSTIKNGKNIFKKYFDNWSDKMRWKNNIDTFLNELKNEIDHHFYKYISESDFITKTIIPTRLSGITLDKSIRIIFQASKINQNFCCFSKYNGLYFDDSVEYQHLRKICSIYNICLNKTIEKINNERKIFRNNNNNSNIAKCKDNNCIIVGRQVKIRGGRTSSEIILANADTLLIERKSEIIKISK